MNEYEYKIVFLDDEANYMTTEYGTFTGNSEEEARDKAEEWADEEAESIDAGDHEITLIDAH